MRNCAARSFLVAAAGLLCAGSQPAALAQSANPAGGTKNDWAYYGHDAGGTRYSPLTQINRENVDRPESRLDISHRRYFRRQRPPQTQRPGNHAHPGRWHPLPHQPVQSRVRRESGNRQATVGLRSDDRTRRRLRRRPHQSRRRHLARSDARKREALPPPNFRSHTRRATDRTRRRDRRPLHGLRQPRANQPARCGTLYSRGISHDVPAGSD